MGQRHAHAAERGRCCGRGGFLPWRSRGRFHTDLLSHFRERHKRLPSLKDRVAGASWAGFCGLISRMRKGLVLLVFRCVAKSRNCRITPMRRYDKEEILSDQLSMVERCGSVAAHWRRLLNRLLFGLGSLNQYDRARPPVLRGERLERAVQPQAHDGALSGHRLDLVAVLDPTGQGGPEVDGDGAIGVRHGSGHRGVQAANLREGLARLQQGAGRVSCSCRQSSNGCRNSRRCTTGRWHTGHRNKRIPALPRRGRSIGS